MDYQSHSPEETQQIAAELAQQIITNQVNHTQATVVALEGELGAGKTTFVQGFVRALGITDVITSPTFVIMKQYPFGHQHDARTNLLVHIDAYRLNDASDLKPLGIEELIRNPHAIILIEWAERVTDILPPDHLTIHLDHIDHIDDHERKITMKSSARN